MTIDRSEVAGTEITIGPQNVELDRFLIDSGVVSVAFLGVRHAPRDRLRSRECPARIAAPGDADRVTGPRDGVRVALLPVSSCLLHERCVCQADEAPARSTSRSSTRTRRANPTCHGGGNEQHGTIAQRQAPYGSGGPGDPDVQTVGLSRRRHHLSARNVLRGGNPLFLLLQGDNSRSDPEQDEEQSVTWMSPNPS